MSGDFLRKVNTGSFLFAELSGSLTKNEQYNTFSLIKILMRKKKRKMNITCVVYSSFDSEL